MPNGLNWQSINTRWTTFESTGNIRPIAAFRNAPHSRRFRKISRPNGILTPPQWRDKLRTCSSPTLIRCCPFCPRGLNIVNNTDKGMIIPGDDFTVPPQILLPNDPFNRYWLELSGANPHLVDQLRPALITFMAFDKDKSTASKSADGCNPSVGQQQQENLVGTGFVMGASEQGLGLVLTAKHVFDGIHTVQTPRQRHAPSTLLFFYLRRTLSQHLILDNLKYFGWALMLQES